MEIRKINTEFAVTGQLNRDDIHQVAALGYRTILCNRPDGESDDQTLFSTIAAVARHSGLEAHCLPVPATGPTETETASFAAIWPGLPKPVLAYCRTGNRALATYNACFATENG